MKIKTLVSLTALTAALVACGGGDININAANNSTTSTDNSVGDNSNNNTGGGNGGSTNNPCAAYTDGGITIQGTFDSNTSNCTYGTDFVDLTRPYDQEEELSLVDLPNDGVHIFNGSLVIGRNFDNDADIMAAGIQQGGDGSVLRIAAGATLAFRSSDDYFVVNRGSQIFAQGTASAPVTVTSVTDAVDGTVDPEAVGEWGGMIINGFGITNRCEYVGTVGEAGFALADGAECHVSAEGRAGAGQTHYGGQNNADNSGELSYFVIKHTGAEVATDNELNGISFNAVGSGTTVEFLEAYSTLDDGIEFFGGAVNVSNYVAVYVRDDSIDIDEGYRGTIDWALVVQSETFGNHCIESDGIGGHDGLDVAVRDDFAARGLNSQATINNLTCIVSASTAGTRGIGRGWLIREGHTPTISNSIMVSSYGPEAGLSATPAVTDADHYCVFIDDELSENGAANGDLVLQNNVFACNVLNSSSSVDMIGMQTVDDFITTGNDFMMTADAGTDPTSAADPNLVLLDSYFSVPLADILVNGAPTTVTPSDMRILGGVSRDNDWTAGWTFGLDPNNRGQDLWFE